MHMPLDYDQTQPPDDLKTIFVTLGNLFETLFSLTSVDDSKFTLTCTASFYVMWEDSRLTLDNFTNRELAFVGTWLKDKIWKPQLSLRKLQSMQPIQFIANEALRKNYYTLYLQTQFCCVQVLSNAIPLFQTVTTVFNVTKYSSRPEIENKIVVVNGYHQLSMKLLCKMNFNAFPLDRQVWYDRLTLPFMVYLSWTFWFNKKNPISDTTNF